MYSGVITALITPFKNGRIDFDSLTKLIDHQIKGGINTIVIGGSTGESTSLLDSEYQELISYVVKHKVSLNIVACCNQSSTEKAVEIAKLAESLGVDGLMITAPYYSRPSQEGLYHHFKSVHNSTSLPIMLYSVPSRTGVDFKDETIFKLCDLERVVAFKDAGGDLERPLRLIAKLEQRLSVFAGDDSLALAFNANGAKGVVSVASNLIPKHMVEIQELWNKGNFSQSLKIHMHFLQLYKALFVETNPVPIKYALSLYGLCLEDVRPALWKLSDANKLLIKTTLNQLEI